MRLEIGHLEIRPIHIVVATGAISLLAVLVIVAVMLPRRPADTVTVEPPPLRYEWVTADRLVLPDDYSKPDELAPIAYRARRERWSQAEIAEYWLDPQTIGLDVLDDRIEARVSALLEEVP